MAGDLRRYFKIWGYQIRNGLMQRMAYRFNFLLLCLAVLMQMTLTIIFVKVIFSFVNNLSGWSYKNALIVVATYMMIEGLMWATCAYLNGVSSNIKKGTLDYLLVKPIDPQFLVTVWRADPEDWMRVLTSAIIFIYSLYGSGIGFFKLLKNGIFYLLLFLNSYIIIYSITLVLKSISFWTIEAQSLGILGDTVTSLSKYPTDIYFHKTVRIFFSTIIPLAFIATIPAKALINGPTVFYILASCLMAALFFAGSRRFWLFALKHYSSASS
jgi:ABC-2 type transport system permease protein